MGVSVVRSVPKLVVRICVLNLGNLAEMFATGALYLSRITGGHISEEEANEVLDGFGPLEKIWIATPTDKEMYRLPEGVFVMWEFFQGARDAYNVRCSSVRRLLCRTDKSKGFQRPPEVSPRRACAPSRA